MTELSPAARKALKQARASFTPSRAELDAVGAAVEALAASAPLVEGAGTPRALPAIGSIGFGRWLGAGVFVAASLGVMLYLRPASSLRLGRTARDGQHAVGALPSTQNATAPAAPAVGLESARDPMNGAPHSSATTARAPIAQLSANGRSKATRAKPARPREQQVSGPATEESRSVAALVNETDTNARVTDPSPSQVQVADQVADPERPHGPELAEPSPDTLAQELRLLRSAQLALERSDAGQALALLERHTMRFPKGVLRQERLAAQAVTLCMLGRTQEAKESMHQLARIAPNSPHLTRLRTSCVRDALPR